jgi:hypothetical protein
MHQRISRLLFSVALTLAISAACQLLAIESGPIARLSATPLYSGRTQDPTAVQLTMQDKDEVIRFKIPRMYMTLSPNWKGGMQDVIAIEVVFPSMAPAGRRSLASADVLSISLYSFARAGGGFSFLRLLQYNQDNEWTRVDRLTDRSGEGYSVYVARSNVEKWKDPTVSVKEYFVPDNSNGRVYFECYREKLNPFVGCLCLTAFGQNLSLSVAFRRSQFERWREILRAVEGLLISFKEGDNPD